MLYRVENIVIKGEIACYKQFLLFAQFFPQLYTFRAALCGNGLIPYQITKFQYLLEEYLDYQLNVFEIMRFMFEIL